MEETKEDLQKSPQKRLRFEDEEQPVRERDEEEGYHESLVDKKLRQLNEERRKHYLKKQQIGRNIESKSRELDFIRGLDSDDVIYMMYKKDLYAAKVIQRWWRLRKLFSKETKEKIKMIRAATIVQAAWRRKKRRKLLSKYSQKLQRKENKFYNKISDEKLNEYEDKMVQRLRTFSTAELGEKNEEQLEREFMFRYRKFYDEYLDNEPMITDTSYSDQISSMLQFLSKDEKVSNLRVWGYDGSTPNFYLK